MEKLSDLYPHYHKDVAHLESVDVYRVLELFGVTDQALGHAIKKLLVAGGRGAKDTAKDIKEARDTLNRKLQMLEEDAAIPEAPKPQTVKPRVVWNSKTGPEFIWPEGTTEFEIAEAKKRISDAMRKASEALKSAQPAEKITTKFCPECGSDRLVLIRSYNKKVCSTCDTELGWFLDPGQKPL